MFVTLSRTKHSSARVEEWEPGIAMSALAEHYSTFRYRLRWSGRYVAGFAGVSGLSDSTAPQWRSGSPRPSVGPEGQGTPFIISLEDGVSYDLGFEQWVCMVRCYGPATGKGSLLPEYRRPFTIEEAGEGGRIVSAYHVDGCWVTEYKAAPGPDTGANEMRIDLLRLGCGSREQVAPGET